MQTTPRHDAPYDVDPAGAGLAGAVVDPGDVDAFDAAGRRRWRRQRLVALLLAFISFALVAGVAAQVGHSDSSAAGTAPKVAVNAEALGVLLLRPGHDPVRLGESAPVAGVSAREPGAHAAYELSQVASVERVTTQARIAIGRRTANAQARAGSISLFEGRVQVTDAALVADVGSRGGRANGSLQLDDATRLLVDGVEREASVNQRIAIEGVGTVIVNEQAVVSSAPTGDAQTGPRHRLVGAIVHVRITQDALGLPAGSELVIGRVDAGVREGKVREVTHPDPTVGVQPPTTPTSIGSLPGLQPGVPRPGDEAIPRRPIDVRGQATGTIAPGFGNYLFPVLGQASFTNDWGAPRASTGRGHEGTDIFAEEGTPIVAVADGVLDRVGWNSIGGYRFWLFDQYGNSFYHAHLSAYSPLARDGARVRRGDVIGFVGHTGDAQGTPPHLHFEVHPGNGGPTNPFPLLNAWKRGVAVAIGLVTEGRERVAPLALLNFSDISANNGLRGSVLDSVPHTDARDISHEHAPQPTDETLKDAIDGPATSAGT